MLLHFPGRHLACASLRLRCSRRGLRIATWTPRATAIFILRHLKQRENRTEAVGSQGPTRAEHRTGNQFEDVWRCLEITIFLGFLRYSSTIQWDRSLVIVQPNPREDVGHWSPRCAVAWIMSAHPFVLLVASLLHIIKPCQTMLKPRSSSIQVSGVTHTVGNSTSSTNFRDAASAAACWRKVLSNCCQPWSWWPSGPPGARIIESHESSFQHISTARSASLGNDSENNN